MLIYGEHINPNNWRPTCNWSQSLKRSTSSAASAASSQPPTKRRKLTLSNKQFLRSLGLTVY